MKTSVEIPDGLLEEVRRLAARENRNLRELIEEGLRHVVSARKKVEAFHLRKASFRGRGLQPEVSIGSWERIRDLIYQGRGT